MILRCTAPSLLVVAGDRCSSRANPISAHPATLTVFLPAIGSKDAPPGVVDYRHNDEFITLAALHLDTANARRRSSRRHRTTAPARWATPAPADPISTARVVL
jgi:hypothetical protein